MRSKSTLRFSLSLFFSLLFIFPSSFGQVLYGLQKTVNGSPTIPFDIVSIDPFTGTTSTLFSTNSLIGVAAGATAYDQQNQRYICWGFDTNNNQRLYTANIDSLSVTFQPIINAAPIEMEYDLKNQKTYGLWYDQSTTTEYFGEVDLATGATTAIAGLPGVEAVAIGNSTFDSNNTRYIFIGIQNGQAKLITVDAITGSILYSVPFNLSTNQSFALEYNINNDKLYGLFNDIDSASYDPIYMSYLRDILFVEIDLTTGNKTIINTTPVLSGYLTGYNLGNLAFDQATQSYIIVLADANGFYLKVVDALTGNVTSTTTLGSSNLFYEMQVDNYDYAERFYDSTSTNVSALLSLDGKIFPNPTTDRLQIDIAENIQTIQIFNQLGQLVLEEQQPQTKVVQVNNFQNGIYTIIVTTADNEVFRSQFVKQ